MAGRGLRASIDRLRDAMGPAAIRKKFLELQRKTGITRSGQIAILGAVLLWFMARVVAGTAMYMFSYGAILLVGAAFLLAPRRLRLEGVREGLFPRVQEGDRLDVELKLTAKRRMSTFILEERLPERLGKPVKVPTTTLSSE